MSIIGYAAITNLRETSEPGASFTDFRDIAQANIRAAEKRTGTADKKTDPKKPYIDAMAALVPAEVLAAHAVVISFTTTIENKVVTITNPHLLFWAFFGLCALSLFLYAVPRLAAKLWDNGWDWVRLFIPALAFVAWTMLQPTSAFDAVCSISQADRAVPVVILAPALGVLAAALAYSVDKKKPKS